MSGAAGSGGSVVYGFPVWSSTVGDGSRTSCDPALWRGRLRLDMQRVPVASLQYKRVR